MKIILTLILLGFSIFGFSQEQLIRLGTVEEINAKVEATNIQPLLVIQNIVYSMPADCFCNRDLNKDASNRNSGKDNSGRNKDNRNAGRNADGDNLNRNSSGDQSGRKSGTDYIYRDVEGSDGGRNSDNDDAGRNSDSANAGRNSDSANAGRNSDSANARRNSDSANARRNSGNAANGRDASRDNLDRNFATAHIVPSCSKKKDSCSIEILGFHHKAKIEYFDKIESIKAVEMIIQF